MHTHPGAILRSLIGSASVTDMAAHLGVSRVSLSRILNGAADLSPDVAIRLSEAFAGRTAEEWFIEQALYNVDKARNSKRKPIPKWTGPASI